MSTTCDGIIVKTTGLAVEGILWLSSPADWGIGNHTVLRPWADCLSDVQNNLPAGHQIQLLGEIAMFDDKLWMGLTVIEPGNPNNLPTIYNAITEWIFDLNTLTISFNRIIDLPSPHDMGMHLVLGQGIDSNTLIVSQPSTTISYDSGFTNNKVYKVDVSGNTASFTHLFDTVNDGASFSRDIIYICDTDTYVYGGSMGTDWTIQDYIFHVDSSGSLLGQIPIDNASTGGSLGWSHGIVCYNNQVWYSRTTVPGTFSSIKQVDLTNYTIVNNPNSYNVAIGDMASNPGCCLGCGDDILDSHCYEIGDITDPINGGAGGMVFATPNTPQNPTPYYYEAALYDVSVGNHPLEHNVNHTVNALTAAESNCGTTPGATPQHVFNNPWDNPIDTNIPNNMCRWGYGPGSFQPFVIPPGINTPTGVNLNDPITALDWQQTQMFPPGTLIDEIHLIPPSTTSVLLNSGVNQILQSLSYESYLFVFNNSTIPTVPPFSQSIKILTTGGNVTMPGPFFPIGSEFGGWGVNLGNLPIAFGSGYDNTTQIVSNPALPVWGTHDVAASSCQSYQVFGIGEKWFLPSLDEFDVLFNNIGPNTPHNAVLGLVISNPESMSDTYWTSSSVPPSLVANSDAFAVAYNVGLPPYPITPVPPNPTGPVVAQRCSVLSVRPVRRFICRTIPDPEPIPRDAYMFCDTWIKPFGTGGPYEELPSGQILGHTFKYKFATLQTPGSCGSGHSYFTIPPASLPSPYDLMGSPSGTMTDDYSLEATIGGEEFTWQITTTDVAGNQWDISDFNDFNNPDGYTIKLWEADGTYLGTWHYASVIEVTREANWVKSTALSQGFSWYNAIPQIDDPTSWDSRDFPDKLLVKFQGVSYIDCPLGGVVNYGYSHKRNPMYTPHHSDFWAVRNSDLSGNYVPITGQGHKTAILDACSVYTSSSGSAASGRYHTNYFNEYYEEAWGGWSASFAMIQIDSEMSKAKIFQGGNTVSYLQGANTVYQQRNVVCAKQIIQDLEPHLSEVHPTTGGHIGVGGHSNWSVGYGNNLGGSWAAYGQFGPNLLHNTTYGGVIVNSPASLPQALDGIIPGLWPSTYPLSNFPKHYFFTWFAAFPPNPSSSLIHFNNLTDGLNAMNSVDSICEAHESCSYQVGDTGPAGGIIVAVPYMNVTNSTLGIFGPSVAPLQGNKLVKNYTNYYYEISPENLNNLDCPNFNVVGQWGFMSDTSGTAFSCDVANNPITQAAWIPDMTLYDTPLGSQSITLNMQTVEMIGQGKVVNDAYKYAPYPTSTPFYDPNYGGALPDPSYCAPGVPSTNLGAFKMCWDYVLNDYNDWFLPTVDEMDFARNYSPPGTLYDSTSNGWGNQSGGFAAVATHNELDGGKYAGSQHYWTCNTYAWDATNPNPEVVAYEADWAAVMQGSINPDIYVDNQSDLGNLIGYPMSGNTLSDFPNHFAYSVSMDPLDPPFSYTTPDDQGIKTATLRNNNLNVRAMRRFQCSDPPPPDPCLTNPDCSCIEYNYRDGIIFMYPSAQGNSVDINSPVGHCGFNNGYWIPDGNGNWIVNPNHVDNMIGDDYFEIIISTRDVKGNNWTASDWIDDSAGYTISMWTRDMHYVGKWHYSTLIDHEDWVDGDPNLDVGRPSVRLKMTGVTHLDGLNGPIVDVGAMSGTATSLIHNYVKIEAACNSNNPNAFEDGCTNNHTVWGGPLFPMYGSWMEGPYVCDPNSFSNPGPPPFISNCFWTWGTQDHYDVFGNLLTVSGTYSGVSGCQNLDCSGSAKTPPIENPRVKFLDNISWVKSEEEFFELNKKPSTKSRVTPDVPFSSKKEKNELEEEKEVIDNINKINDKRTYK